MVIVIVGDKMMDIAIIVQTILISMAYSLFIYIQKYMGKEEKFAPEKTLRTIVLGLIVGVLAFYYGVDPTFKTIGEFFELYAGLGFVVVLADHGTIILMRIFDELKEKF